MERSEELQDLVRTSFEAYSRGDTSLIDRHTSSHDGVRLIGSDPNDWFEGASGRSLETRDAGRRRNGLLHGEVNAFVEGNVDWVSSRPVWTLEDGTEIPTRSTVVFSMEVGEWKMVQGHTSVGVSNEELFGE